MPYKLPIMLSKRGSMNLKNLKTLISVATLSLTLNVCEIPGSPITFSQAFASEATLYSAVGTVEILNNSATVWEMAAKDRELNDGDTIRTGLDSRAGLVMPDGSLLRLGPNSVMTIRGKSAAKEEGIFLKIGKLFFFSRSEVHTPEVRTPTVSAAIRGTEFTVETSDEESTIAILDGQVECYNEFGSVPAGGGELVSTKRGQAPVKTLLIKPKEKVQWALHIPPFLAAIDPNTSEDVKTQVKKAYRALAEGDFVSSQKAASEIARIPSANAIGGSIETFGLIGLDQQEAAVAKAQEATRQAPSSELAVISLSYALQASGRVSEALDAIRAYRARLGDQNGISAFLLTRSAELELANNNVAAAEKEVREALSRTSIDSTTLAYALTVEGFLSLVENMPERAEAKFDEAANLDSTYPTARLGKGLALTQMGRPEDGAASIATAVHLAPTTSVYRSYLGKALFELNKNSVAEEEFNRAIALDPNDPTPKLYRSFQRLAENNPVGALEDLSDSVKLNGNRAVYRSSLLLDQDQAVRKASLAEVFGALGFGEVARVQALNSINQDYTNFSGHRYLANAYSRNFQFEAGRSERALANLLAPLGFNSLQPLGENTFGDYTTLFERNEERTAITHGIDSQLQRFTASATQSGRKDDMGYFISGSGLYNDFSPMSNQLKDGLLSAAFQYQPTSALRTFLLTEAQGRQVRSAPDDFGAESDQIRRYAATLGGTYKLSPDLTLLSVSAYQYGNNSIRQPVGQQLDITAFTEEGLFEGSEAANLFDNSKQTPEQFQLSNQLLYHGDVATLTLGQELFVSRVSRNASSRIINDEFGITDIEGLDIPSSIDSSLRNHSVFGYSTFHLGSSLDLSLGGAFTTVESEDRFITPFSPNTTRHDRFNPKAALTWRPTTWATLRGAYIESMERSILEGLPSYEPSLVGAVNQRYFDFPHTFSRNTTLAVDLNPTAKTFVGFEATHRDISLLEISPASYGVDLTDPETIPTSINLGDRSDVHQDVDLLSSYWYQVLTDWLVSTTEYRFTLDNTFDPARRFRIETHRGSFGLKAFDSSGWFIKGTSTYIDQQRTLGLPEENGSTNGLLVDAGVGYRFAQRHGIVELDFKNLLDRDLNVEPLLEVDTVYLSGFGVTLVGTYNF